MPSSSMIVTTVWNGPLYFGGRCTPVVVLATSVCSCSRTCAERPDTSHAHFDGRLTGLISPKLNLDRISHCYRRMHLTCRRSLCRGALYLCRVQRQRRCLRDASCGSAAEEQARNASLLLRRGTAVAAAHGFVAWPAADLKIYSLLQIAHRCS